MPIDPSIILGVKPIQIQQRDPFEAYGKSLALKGLMQKSQLQDQELADNEAYKQVFRASAGDSSKIPEALLRGGMGKQYLEYNKAQLENDKTRAITTKDNLESVLKATAMHRDQLANVNNPQSAAQWVTSGYNDALIGPVVSRYGSLDEVISRIPQDEAGFNKWKQQASLGATEFIKQNKPKIDVQNTGAYTQTISTPGLGGESSISGRVQNTQTPDSVASQSTQRRGQDMVNARARDRLSLDQGTATAEAGGPSQAAYTKIFGKAEPGRRWKADGSQEAIPGGSQDIKAGELGVRNRKRAVAAMESANNVRQEVKEATALVGLDTAGAGGLLAMVPATQARNLQAKLTSIKANIGFDRLQQMREESPTGGALGQVAVQELVALQSTIASLDQLQSPREMRSALGKIDKHYTRWAETVEQAATGAGGATGSFDAPTGAAPAMPSGFKVIR